MLAYFGLFWPIFIGLNNAIAYQKWQISGMTVSPADCVPMMILFYAHHPVLCPQLWTPRHLLPIMYTPSCAHHVDHLAHLVPDVPHTCCLQAVLMSFIKLRHSLSKDGDDHWPSVVCLRPSINLLIISTCATSTICYFFPPWELMRGQKNRQKYTALIPCF